MKEKEYISQVELARLTGKKRQWINYLVSKGRFNIDVIAGKKLIIKDQKVLNFINESQ